MRQIKLRIKLKNKHDGKEITLYNDVFDAMNGIAFYNIDRTDWEFIRVDQYTGLKDKNGKEIYEGDIVKCKEATEPEDLGFTVVWHNNGFNAQCNRQVEGEFIITSLDDYFKNKTEVIGNIYENPELLK